MKIDDALTDLTKTISDSDIYHKYQHILKQVEKSSDIEKLVKDIKALQKRLVHAESKGLDPKPLESELELKKKILYDIPLYQDYINVSDELRDLMKMVELKIQTYVNSLNI